MNSDGVSEYFEGSPVLAAYNAIKQEIEERQSKVEKFDIGYINGYTEEGLKRGWVTDEGMNKWERLQVMLKKYKTVNRHEWSDHRGDHRYWGELVDDNGELVALYNYKVDSSG